MLSFGKIFVITVFVWVVVSLISFDSFRPCINKFNLSLYDSCNISSSLLFCKICSTVSFCFFDLQNYFESVKIYIIDMFSIILLKAVSVWLSRLLKLSILFLILFIPLDILLIVANIVFFYFLNLTL